MSANNLLIATAIDDVHSAAVSLVLRRRGLTVDHFCSMDYPGFGHIQHRLRPGMDEDLLFTTPRQHLALSHYDVVWWRRYFGFPVDVKALHPDDRWFVESGNRAYSQDFPFLVAPQARWINSPLGETTALNKSLTLRMARRLGLSVLDTLITNSRDAAQAFIAEKNSAGREVVFKTFYPNAWASNEGGIERVAYTHTCVITSDQLVDDDMFRLCPVILQEKCTSRYEIRALFMGDEYVAVRYNEQTSASRYLDARRSMLSPGGGRRCELPGDVALKCRALLAELGCSFASFDLLVDQDGSCIFLELNPEGQFLWMEVVCPELKVLEPVCNFMHFGRVDFAEFERRDGDIVLSDLLPELKAAQTPRTTATEHA